jgi:hypothetical protein
MPFAMSVPEIEGSMATLPVLVTVTAAFVEERLTDGKALGATVALPTAASGANLPFTLSGSATSEGALSRSVDGRYVTAAGYAAAPGTSGVSGTSTATVNRVGARVDAAGTVDTSTHLTSLMSGNNVRGATSIDGSAYWLSGASNGLVYVAHSASSGTNLVSAPGNTRVAGIFGGQAYVSSQAASYVGIDSVGAGVPTTGGQTSALVAASGASGSPYAFAFLDLSSSVAGVDTLYVADDRATATGGGVQKWTFDGTAWTLRKTLTSGLGSGTRGLAAVADGSTVVLVATTAEPSQNTLVVAADDGSSGVTFQTVATAPANTVFRGVAPAPR